jgi:hypothetical protein
MDPDIIDVQETAYKKSASTTKAMLPVDTQSMDKTLKVYKPEVVGSVPNKDHQAWFYDTPGIMNENQVFISKYKGTL